jgi:S1-C subfamily serine protease
VQREVYAIRSLVRSGNSGGPLIDTNGRVLGIVFATARDSSDTGFVLTNAEVMSDATAGRSAKAPVSTGTCTP